MRDRLKVLNSIHSKLEDLDSSIQKLAKSQLRYTKFSLGLIHDNLLEAKKELVMARIRLEECCDINQ